MLKSNLVPIARKLFSLLAFNEDQIFSRAIAQLPINDGLGLFDVGAAGGVQKRWQMIIGDLNYFGFEPDQRSFKNLEPNKITKLSKIFPFVLWSE